MDHELNPYAAPQTAASAYAVPEGVLDTTAEAERIRREYLNHEVSVKSIRWLYYLGGVGSVLLTVLMPIIMFNKSGFRFSPLEVLILLLVPLFGMLSIWGGLLLGRLDRKARLPVGIVSGIGLIHPVGLFINGYILWLVFGKKGKFVMSDEYREVIRLTPHIRYKTSRVVWGVLALLLIVIVLGVGAAILGTTMRQVP